MDAILDDYIEIREPAAFEPERRPTLPPEFQIRRCASIAQETRCSSAPLQSYLAERFADLSVKGPKYRALRRENQRRFDAAWRNWPSAYT